MLPAPKVQTTRTLQKAEQKQSVIFAVVGPEGVSTQSNFNDLICPTGLKTLIGSKSKLSKLSSPALRSHIGMRATPLPAAAKNESTATAEPARRH
jgi:hypothetical protein